VVSIEESLKSSQASCDEWQSKHRLVQLDNDALTQAITQVSIILAILVHTVSPQYNQSQS